ncbi:hypothetical protein H310_12429 [Aphanomyces invadans]|uniref:GCF C-terminal domain-containing protein n=1 Tax=Aphanomyces invadans TaxID=157072 RepID=A0A024TJ71_9STRA|nr:hypothetical protein H310_12429 [Aphanomyces invadans]ETV93661.1 hypothetical protein H310_12429 [Aphanomyces invadans]|eukprot:XP_008877703.1 hypothetical protein H310_12429 [Aphanomyces invadans]
MFRARKATTKKPSAASKSRQVDEDDAQDEVNQAQPPFVRTTSSSTRVDESSDKDEEEESVDAIRARIKLKQRKPANFSSSNPKRRSVIASFHDDDNDDDGPAFRVRKGKIPRMSVDESILDSPTHDMYSVENMNALKAQQKTFPSAPAQSSPVSPSREGAAPQEVPVVDNPSTTSTTHDEEAFIPLNSSPRSSHRQAYHLPTDDSNAFRPPRCVEPEEAFLDTDPTPDAAIDEEDPAEMQWEAEQLRRVGIHPTPSHSHAFSSTSDGTPSQLSFQSLGQLLTKLQTTHASLLDQKDLRTRDAQRTSVEMNQLTASIASLEAELTTCGVAFDDMQRLWEFLTTLCHCLRAKVRAVDELDRGTSESPEPFVHPRQVQSNLWSDVDDDFSTLDAVLDRFTQWKTLPHTAASFHSTYAALALEQLIVPYIRAELLSYSPWLHRWEDLDWVDAVRAFDSNPGDGTHPPNAARKLIDVGMELVVERALRMVRHFDWNSRVHAEHALYLLQSVSLTSLQQQITQAMEEWAFAQPLPSMPRAAKRVFLTHLTLLRLPRTNALVVQVCQDELAHVQDAVARSATVLPDIEAIVKDWPCYCTEARPILTQFAVLVNNLNTMHQPESVVAKNALLINIELKLNAR